MKVGDTFKIGDVSEIYHDDVTFTTLSEHISTDVPKHIRLGEVLLEVIDIGASVITVKSHRDYTFQKNERISLIRGGIECLPYLNNGDINKAIKFLTQCGVESIDYVAVPIERASDLAIVLERLAFYNLEAKDVSNDADLRKIKPFYEGLIAKIGSKAGLNDFEEILSKLNADKDAIMIDRTNLALELKNKEKLDTATTHFIKKSNF